MRVSYRNCVSGRPLGGVLLALCLEACSASTERPAVDATLSNPKLRHESLEATLRVTDEHPEYVDELFALTLKHPVTLDRFLQNTAAALEREDFSRATARRLAERPGGLRQVMIANFDAISDKPASLDGVSQAMLARPQIAAMATVQRPDTVRAIVHALMMEVLKNRTARVAFLEALQENSGAMAHVIAPNPKVMASLLRAFSAESGTSGKKEFEALIDALTKSD
jgi:hypothetical protein